MLKDNPFGTELKVGELYSKTIKCITTGKELGITAQIYEDGTQHVSVACTDRDPLWKEMCFVRNRFWGDTDVIVQIHPTRKQYVNIHEHCLHLWKLGHMTYDSIQNENL